MCILGFAKTTKLSLLSTERILTLMWCQRGFKRMLQDTGCRLQVTGLYSLQPVTPTSRGKLCNYNFDLLRQLVLTKETPNKISCIKSS
jgi:hypothetical protein